MMGDGMVSGAGCVAYVFRWFQKGLLEISFARSVIISMITHHSAGLKEPPKVSRKYINAQIVVEHMHFTADGAFICILLYAESRSYLLIRITIHGNA